MTVTIRGGTRDGEKFQPPIGRLCEGDVVEYQGRHFALHCERDGRWYAVLRERPLPGRPQSTVTFRPAPPRQSKARYEFFGGPLDTEKLFVPTKDGEPCDVVYCNRTGVYHNYPQAVPDRIDGPWVQYRFKLNIPYPLRSTYHYEA